MGKLLLMATGGTIACLPSEKGLVPGLSAAQLLEAAGIDAQDIDCVDVFNMDSSNIQPEEWMMLCGSILSNMEGYSGIIITHGTDTMAYSASMLSFMLQGIEIPVIFTGSQYPVVYPDSDGRKNLKNSVIAARTMEGGVFICFGDAIIRGCRAVKTRTTSLNAFESINHPYVGAVVNGRYIPLLTEHLTYKKNFSAEIDPRVALIKLIPGTSQKLIDVLPSCGIKGVVVEAFGLGGVHNIRRDHARSICALMDSGIPVILTSQCLYEASALSVYEVSHALKDGVISAFDMTTEAAVTKLMWTLKKTQELDEIVKLIHTDMCGEITIKK